MANRRPRSRTTQTNTAARRPPDTDDEWLRAAFAHSTLGIGRLDASARVLDGNRSFARFFDRGMSTLRSRSIAEFSVTEDADAITTLVSEVARGDRDSAAIEARFVRRDGHMVWGSLMVSRVARAGGSGLVAVLQDISARKALERDLLHRAFHDALTDLANRQLLRDRMDHAVARAMREPEHLAIIILDLDDFKSVNDTQGHAAGDRLLQRIASALLSVTRGCDTVARLGGDEFAVLLEGMQDEDGHEVAAQRIVNALSRPIEIGEGRMVTVRASIGIAMYRPGEGSDELLRNADVALYEAKSRRRGRWVVYDPGMHAALVDKVSLEADLRAAIEVCQLEDKPGLKQTGAFPRFPDRRPAQGWIHLAYQPVVDVISNQILGFEALLRWTHPERGDVPPTTFIPVAEETGLILPLGRWALRAACEQASRWNAMRSHDPLHISVNLSAKQILDEQLANDVEAALAESELPPDCLTLEITESVIMQESAVTRTRLNELKELGIRLAIDDFGTGYSSLSYLQQFPIDVLKIDQTFLHRMHQGANDAALVRTIIGLAKLLSLHAVAEGVEDTGQQEQLRDLGCDSAQGFLFGRPMNAQEAESWLASVRGKTEPSGAIR